MFIAREEKLGPLLVIKLINENTGEYISILPEKGACLNEIVLAKNNIKYPILEGSETIEEFFKDESGNKFKNSNLFPFPNRINHGYYEFDGKHYQLEKNFPKEENAIHGVILSSSFKIKGKSESENEVNVFLEHQFEGNSGYPFKCKLEINYSLSDSEVKCNTKIINASENSIPVGHGWHPYFKTGNKLDNLFLKIPSNKIFEVNERMIPTGKMKSFDYFLELSKINNQHFDFCFKMNPTANGVSETILSDKAKDIQIIFWQESGNDKYNFLQVYIPPDRQSIALEPCTCAPDAFNNKIGLIILQPGQSKKLTYGVKLK